MPVGPIESSSIQGVLLTENNIQKPGLGDHFNEFLTRANSIMKEAEQIGEDFAAGKHNNIHETMMAAERATITFKLVGAVRNRMLTAYNEVMNMRM
ncbi:MAG: flagellar hook-basal body complex protein FliE [Deltaproteobacteria bacterium]|nr:flagellar hook-basal body complex protein FliE [Deltaproteobacteria bacterium]MBN2673712.1 flagellar hook-basal body complex protein FliE [Deltaproteobacteria bacterium]